MKNVKSLRDLPKSRFDIASNVLAEKVNPYITRKSTFKTKRSVSIHEDRSSKHFKREPMKGDELIRLTTLQL